MSPDDLFDRPWGSVWNVSVFAVKGLWKARKVSKWGNLTLDVLALLIWDQTPKCLERGRNADVDDVIASWFDGGLRLTLISDEYPAVELWQAERNAAELIEDAFGRAVSFDSFAPPLEWSEVELAPSDPVPLDQ